MQSLQKPRVTVLIPVHNAENFIKDTIQSILNQTFNNLEILIIDDFSTDNSIKIIRQIKDRRIRIIQNKKNLGISDSLNKGLDSALGDFIARMDADDIAMPQRIERQLKYFDAHPEIDILGTGFKTFGNGMSRKVFLPVTHEEIMLALAIENVFAHPTVMLKKEKLMNLDLRYRRDFDGAEDYDLWTRAAKILRTANLPEILLRYRIHPHQTSFLKRIKQEELKKKIIKNYIQELGLELTSEELEIHYEIANSKAEVIMEHEASFQSWYSKMVAFDVKFSEVIKAKTTQAFYFSMDTNLRKKLIALKLVEKNSLSIKERFTQHLRYLYRNIYLKS